MTKLMQTTLVLFLALGGILGGSSPAAADVLSPRVLHAVQQLERWTAEGGEPPALPLYAGRTRDALAPEGVAGLAAAEPRLRLLAVTDDVQALRDAGAEVSTVAGRVAVFEAPLSAMRGLEGVQGLRSVTFPMPLRPSLDVSLPEINATQVHGSTLPPYGGFTGNGVVVGVIDTGIDVAHDDFKNSDGTTRISYLWDQTDIGGPKPLGFNYGTQWTAANINGGGVRERDTDGHGTHVTGIAAGNGRATGNGQPQYTYVGVAPEAEIISCKTTFFTADVIDAIAWLQNRAGGKPSVINLSLGGQMGPHDGTDVFDMAMEGRSGPGRIIVAAVGNDGGSGIHAQATVPGSGTLDIHLDIPTYTATSAQDVVLLDGWYAGSGNLAFTVISPNAHSTGEALASTQWPVSTGKEADTADGYIFLGQGRSTANSDRNVEIDIWDRDGLSQPPAPGQWTVRCRNVSTTATEVDVWMAYASLPGVDVTWDDYVDNTELVSSPASSDSVLSVSAYVTKKNWTAINGNYTYGGSVTVGAIAFFSSPGPNRTGGQKPDISAPGMGIASTKGANATSSLFAATNVTMPDGKHVLSQGTSQAAPHVAGVTALLLEASPALAMKDVRTRLATSARHDSFTGMGWSSAYGHGKVDALAALNLIVPVRFLALTAGWEDGNAVVRWTLRETEPGARFQVERAPTSAGPFRNVSGFLFGDLDLVWTDPNPDESEPWYRVSAFQRDGSLERYGPVHLDPVAGSIRLWQNAPNPFASGTVISYELDRARAVRLDVVDVAGRLVTTLVEGEQPGGRHEIGWDGVDATGRPSAAGVYFARLSTAASIQVRRMVLAR